MNNELKDRVYDVPQEVLAKIGAAVASLPNSNVPGIQRAKTLMNDKKVTYGQLKRIIHDMKTIDKVKNKITYDLYGGELMEKWANTFLDGERQLVKSKKTASQNINNNTGLNGFRKNAFRKTHSKNDSSKSYPNLLKSNSEQNSISSITGGISEEVERIKKLML